MKENTSKAKLNAKLKCLHSETSSAKLTVYVSE